MTRMPPKDKSRLLVVLYSFVNNPYQGDIQKLEGRENVWRRRVGVYRIIYQIETKDKIVNVLGVFRRTDTTYK